MQAFRLNNALLSTDADKAQVMLERLKTVSDSLNQARVETLNAKASYDQCGDTILNDPEKAKRVVELLKSSSFSVMSATDEQLVRQELFQHETRLGDLKRQYGEKHPSVLLIQGRVDQLNVTYAAAIVRRYELARAKETDLQQLLDKQQGEALVEAAKASEYARLESDANRLQKQIDLVDGRVKEVNLVDDGGAPSITVLEPARADDKPAFPS
jgi:uncharacterized protein involved in exopolysaccharide biosynthesis